MADGRDNAAEILSYDPARQASFPDRGWTLADDAVDSFLAILTNGKVTEDKVGPGPHGDLLSEFLCLGPPHNGWWLSHSRNRPRTEAAWTFLGRRW